MTDAWEAAGWEPVKFEVLPSIASYEAPEAALGLVIA
jgi:hypothetical protein